MGNSIGLFEIACQDGAALRQFYRRLFDWEFAAAGVDGYSHIGGGSQDRVQGLLHEEEHGPIETLIYVTVPDVQKALDHAESLGGKTIVSPTHVVGSKRIAQFEDPEGNIIGLVEG